MTEAAGDVRWLRWAVPVERRELPALVLSFVYFFCLLCSYYMLRPVRDEMGIRGGVENLQWLFSATFVAMLVASPTFAAMAARLPRRTLVPMVYAFFIVCILGFFAWMNSGVATPWAARVFFVWLSVFNLFVVSVFWSFMADIYDSAQARRLFGVIAAGGSLGAIAGPGVTALLAARIGPANLLPLAAAVLAVAVPCAMALGRWARGAGGRAETAGAVGGGFMEGVMEVAASRYLLGICVFIWLYTTLSTFLYFEQARIIEAAFADSATRTSVFAGMDLAVNVLTVSLQLLATERLVRRLGLPAALALVPVVVGLGFAALAVSPGVGVLIAFQIVRRAGNYALARPGREMLFTTVTRGEKYKAKNFIDTVVYRGGDAASGWAYAGLAGLGLGLSAIALVAVPLAALWAVIGAWLGRRHLMMVGSANHESG